MHMANGIYVLVISINRDIRINIGALGNINFTNGLYAYVGSAQKGLEKRVKRHLRKAKRKFWHIDYLLADDSIKVLKVFHKKAGKVEECKIASEIGKKSIPLKEFGSSNCKCPSHLFKLKDYQSLRELMYTFNTMPIDQYDRKHRDLKILNKVSDGENIRAGRLAWYGHWLYEPKVAGSSPARPTKQSCCQVK